MEEKELIRVSFSLERKLYERFEKTGREYGYENRSEFIRDMIRKQLTEHRSANGGKVIGSVNILFDRTMRGTAERILEAESNFSALILGSTHIQVTPEICSLMVMLQGEAARIQEYVCAVRSMRGVLQTEFSITSF